MSAVTLKKSYILLLSLGLAIPALQAQNVRTVSALNALELLSLRFGQDSVSWVAEMRATGGQPQPLQWDVLAYDKNSTGLLHHFRASGGVVQDGGPDSRRYPNDAPNGFFRPTDIKVDSIAAFTIAEAEARKAKLGFDSCDYFLQKREFSREAVWKLELVDANHRLVGSVFISGTNGQVYRTVWVRRDSITGFPIINDSLSPNNRSFTGITDGGSNFDPLTGQPGITGITSPPIERRNPSFSPDTPGNVISQSPSQTTNPVPRTGSIFKEFSSHGGGSSRGGSLPPSTNPLDPDRPAILPEPEPLLDPIDPVINNPAPPIDIPSNSGGSSARIPPPPVPR